MLTYLPTSQASLAPTACPNLPKSLYQILPNCALFSLPPCLSCSVSSFFVHDNSRQIILCSLRAPALVTIKGVFTAIQNTPLVLFSSPGVTEVGTKPASCFLGALPTCTTTIDISGLLAARRPPAATAAAAATDCPVVGLVLRSVGHHTHSVCASVRRDRYQPIFFIYFYLSVSSFITYRFYH